jgi:MFS family permease
LTEPSAPEPGLLRNRDFVSLWAGQSVSMAGSAISFIGLPLVAVFTLRVSPIQLGLISAVQLLPPVLAGPFIGPLCDRYSRYRLMLLADMGRALLLASVPVCYLLGILGLWLMVLVAFSVGVLTALFNVAFPAFLPSVVRESQLGDGNAKLSASQSASGVIGPGLASGLIALGGSAAAVAADAFSYVISAAALLRIRTRDSGRPGVAGDRYWESLRVGFAQLRRDSLLVTVTRSNAVMACFAQMQSGIYFLFLTATLHFGATAISVIFVAAGVLGIASAFGCDWLAGRLGYWRLIVIGQLIMTLGGAFLALAAGSRWQSGAFITAGEACFEVGGTLWSVGRTTLFQLRVADELRGRVMGASRFLSSASTPAAALLGGVLASAFGLRAALLTGAAGMLLGMALVLPGAARSHR